MLLNKYMESSDLYQHTNLLPIAKCFDNSKSESEEDN